MRCEAFWQLVQLLEYQLHRYLLLVFLHDLLPEIFLERLPDHEDQLAEAGIHRVIDGIVHDGFAIGPYPVELLKSSIAASHAGRQYK